MTLPSLKNTTLKKPPHFGVSGSVKNQLLVLSKSCVPMINLKSITGKEPIEANGLL